MLIRALNVGFLLIVHIIFGVYPTKQSRADITQDSAVVSSDNISTQSNHLLKLIEQQRIDSLKRKELENRLLSIELGDRREKQELLDELNFLRSRDSLILAQRKQKVDSMRAINKGVPVIPFRDTILTVYTTLGSYSAKERAAAVTTRIQHIAKRYDFDIDSLRIDKDERSYLISWQDQVIVSVDDQDALWMDTDAATLASIYLQDIKQSIRTHKEETSLENVLKGAAQALLIVVLLLIVFNALSRISALVKKRALQAKETKFKGIRIRGYELISAHRQIKFIWLIINVFRWVLMLTLGYIALLVVFNIFPQTRGYAPILLSYFLDPIRKIGINVIAYLPNLITILVICIIFRYILRLLRFLANELQTGALKIPGFYADWALPTYHILRVLLLAFLIIVIFPYLPGSDSPIFQGVSVFVGVLFTFGSAGALSNIVAGLVITYMRPYLVGDRVKIGDVTGDIIEKTLLVTRIRTTKNEVISVPNSQVMNSHTINFSADAHEKGLIIHTNITMGYDITWQQVHELAKRAADKVELIEKDPPPFILQSSLDDFYITYQVNAYTKSANQQALIYSELHKYLVDEFHAAGIELMSPHYRSVRENTNKEMPGSPSLSD